MRAIVRCRNVGILYRQVNPERDAPPIFTGTFVTDLAIPSGSLTAIVGPSGSGKSTLLSLISALKKPNYAGAEDGAELSLNLADSRRVDLLREEQPEPGDLGYVFQEAHLMKPLSAYMNFQAGGLVADKDVGYKTFRLFAQEAGFKGRDPAAALARTQISALSGGQAQRIAVGRALAADPELLVCDEPTSSLDSETGRAILTLIRSWAIEHGRTAIWVTHNIEQACEFADGFLVTTSGRVFADGNLPFRFDSDDLAARRAMLDAKLISFETTEPLCEAAIVPLAPMSNREPTFVVRLRHGLWSMRRRIQRCFSAANHAPDRSKARTQHASAALWTFLARCVFADMFRGRGTAADMPSHQTTPVVRSDNERRYAIRQFAAGLVGHVASFNNWGMTIILWIGMIALYAALVSLSAVDRYFDRRLSEPDVSHFIVAGSGRGQDGHDLFSATRLYDLQKQLVRDYAPATLVGLRPPQVFGRRSNLIAQFGRAKDGSCLPLSGDTELYAETLVASSEEPLYRDVFRGSASPQVAAQSGSPAAVVTEQFAKRLAPEDEAPTPEGFCYYDLGKTYVKIGRVVAALPGSGRNIYHVAFEDQTFLRLYRANPPTSAFDDRGRQRDPNYQTAAVYFDPSYAERLICEFLARTEQKATECAGVAKRASYVTNSDVLTQLSSLLGTANATRAIILAVILLFFVMIVISTVFALNAFVLENEKFLSILKAFRYRLLHILAIGWLQSGILLVFTLVILSAFLLFLDVTVVPRFAARFDIPVSWIELNPTMLLVSLVLIAALAASVIFVVLYLWWHRNRYVGEKLQKI